MKRTLVAAVLSAAILVPTAAVLAKDATAPATSAQQTAVDYDRLMKLSDDGFKAVRDLRSARIAIFDGRPDAASKAIDAASGDIGKARDDLKNVTGRSNASTSGEQWVPVDASLDIADNFVLNEAKSGHIAKANEHFKDGDKQKAVEQLKLAEIDVNLTRLMLPLQATTDHIKVAKTMIDQKKYYEANLALKAAEDGVVIDTVALVDVPKSDAGKVTTATPSAAQPAAPTAAGAKK